MRILLGALFSVSVVAGCVSLAAPSVAEEPIFYRGNHVCQRGSSGYVVCRDPRDHNSRGYIVGGRARPDRDQYRDDYYGGYGGGREGEYRAPNGHVCQRGSSGYVVCRDPRDQYSNGYIVGGRPRPDRDAYRDGYYRQY